MNVQKSLYKQQLLEMIDALIEGRWDVPTFEKHYYRYFLEDVPEDAIESEREYDFFARAQEKLDWTSASPPPEDRDVGWIDYAEYVEWLGAERKRVLLKADNPF